jgi:hypothetical protein
MKNKNKEELIRIGYLIAGVIIGIVIVVSMPDLFPQKYQNKTAYQWSTENDKTKSQLDTLTQSNNELKTAHANLVNCISNLNKYTDYYGGVSYYVADVASINQCILDNKQYMQDQYNNDQEQQQQQQQDILDQKMQDQELGN